MRLKELNELIDRANEISKKMALTDDPQKYEELKKRLMALVTLIRDAEVDVEEVTPPQGG